MTRGRAWPRTSWRPRRTRSGRLLRAAAHPGVPRPRLAQVASERGDQIARVALASLMLVRSDSVFLVAATFAVSFVPAVFGSALLGSVADRLPRKAILLSCDLVRAVLIGVLALLAVDETPLGCCSGCCSSPSCSPRRSWPRSRRCCPTCCPSRATTSPGPGWCGCSASSTRCSGWSSPAWSCTCCRCAQRWSSTRSASRCPSSCCWPRCAAAGGGRRRVARRAWLPARPRPRRPHHRRRPGAPGARAAGLGRGVRAHRARGGGSGLRPRPRSVRAGRQPADGHRAGRCGPGGLPHRPDRSGARRTDAAESRRPGLPAADRDAGRPAGA